MLVSADGPSRKDGAYCIASSNSDIYHYESERYTRAKEGPSDPLLQLISGVEEGSVPFSALVDIQDELHVPISYFVDSSDLSRIKTFVNPDFVKKDELNIHVNPEFFSVIQSREDYRSLFLLGEGVYSLYALSNAWKKINLPKSIHYYSHHYCHAIHALHSRATYEDCLILSIDGGGPDWKTSNLIVNNIDNPANTNSPIVVNSTVLWRWKNNTLTQIFNSGEPYYNFGILHNGITEYILGSTKSKIGGNQCGTVMAMSSFCSPDIYYSLMDQLAKMPTKQSISNYLAELLGKNCTDFNSFSLAASVQKYIEDRVTNLLDKYYQPNFELLVTGGVALNSVMTYKISQRFDFKSIYVPPVPYDAGLCLGIIQDRLAKLKKPNIQLSSYLGSSYSVAKTKEAISKFPVDSFSIIQDVDTEKISHLILNGNIISSFSGRSESGRRALGNRSIFADPRSLIVRDKINKSIKHRQWFRPFAPVILSNYIDDWFVKSPLSPYMSFVTPIRSDKIMQVPAIAHLDGTARLQTIGEESRHTFVYQLLESFYNKTNVPILLNTSFNDREPIVETPFDALKCFQSTQLDYLYFADHKILLKKIVHE